MEQNEKLKKYYYIIAAVCVLIAAVNVVIFQQFIFAAFFVALGVVNLIAGPYWIKAVNKPVEVIEEKKPKEEIKIVRDNMTITLKSNTSNNTENSTDEE